MSPSTTASEGLLPGDTRPLTAIECHHWLRRHHQGRLGYLSGRGQRAVVVSYKVAGGLILVQVPDYNDIAQYAPGAAVTLAVDGTAESTPAGGPTTSAVTVTGTAACVDETTRPPVDSVPFEESWPTGIKTSVVALPLTNVEGFRRPTDQRRADDPSGTP
jgi:hypothetical protein